MTNMVQKAKESASLQKANSSANQADQDFADELFPDGSGGGNDSGGSKKGASAKAKGVDAKSANPARKLTPVKAKKAVKQLTATYLRSELLEALDELLLNFF